MMTTKKTNNGADINARTLAIGVLGVLVCLLLAFPALVDFEQTATPPLVALTINQAGCEYVAAAGVATEKHTSTCQIKVRYRKDMWNDGGAIQLDKGQTLQISAGLVVGMVRLDDGSNEPWTDEHRRAAALIGVAFALIIFFMWVLSRSTRG